MSNSIRNRSWVGVVAGLVLAACGPNIVGSRYVKSADLVAGQAALFTVDATENAQLAGLRLEVPAGALGAQTHLTLELGLQSILGPDTSAGPIAVFGPAGTTFSSDVTLTLPVTGVLASDDVAIVAQDENGASWEIDTNQVVLNATRTFATFKLRKLATFQPRRRVACTADVQCGSGLLCRNGHCAPPVGTPTDGGPGCSMTCPMNSVCNPSSGVCTQTGACMSNAECPVDLACVNGTCEYTAPIPCNSSVTCAAGQLCVNHQCTTDRGDGGSTNPSACMADADCVMGQRCVNGACRYLCIPTMEQCNGLDDDCDGQVDEGCSMGDAGVECGGFAGLACPSGFVCQFNSMVCDPADGGADCSGQCVPDADGGVDGGVECGGLAGLACPSGMVCVYPSNTCPDCTGVCQVDVDGGVDAGMPCGGFGGLQCPSGFTCYTDQALCDGGTDCLGECQPDAIDAGMSPACMTSADCAMGQSCVNGLCR